MRIFTCAGFLTTALATTLSAGTVDRATQPETGAATIHMVSADAIRPQLRPVQGNSAAPTQVSASQRFQDWTIDFMPRAISQGISQQIWEQAFDDVVYDAGVIRRDQNQSEFSKTIWEYLDSAASDARIRNGKSALNTHLATLEAIENKYGVEKEVVVAVWGLESAYGSFRGSNDIIQSLATLAFYGRRGAFFEEQLIAALKILQNGDTTARNMTGSWAGAMGHTQFIPTSYLSYAVDFTGDGKRNIWSDDPSDALASTAAYLAQFGWITGQPWGVEVQLPDGFAYEMARRDLMKAPSEWAKLGVTDMDGKSVEEFGLGSILLPAGADGAAFMVFKNFAVIERYNTADAYVIGVGHLSDRIKGGAAIQADWPRSDRALTFSERKEMQQHLTSNGYDTQGVDGRIGPLTIAAVRAFQTASGMTPDGYASLRLLKELR